MKIGRWAAVAVVIVATAACSDSAEEPSDPSPTVEESASADSDAPEAGSDVPEDVQQAMVERMTAMDGLFGEPPSEEPEVLPADEFNAGAPETQIESLEDRGFEAGSYQNLVAPETVDAVRAVLRFESAEGAEEDVAAGADDLPGEAETEQFRVPGVPGATGFDVYGQTGLVGRNIAFSVGEYEYLLGYAAEAPPSEEQPTRSEFAEVAAQWYERVSELD